MPNGEGSDSGLILEEVLARLDAMSLVGLRDFWRERWGPPPPNLRSEELLRLLIAWRLQAPTCGGLDASIRRRLKGVRTHEQLAAGCRITREYRGVLHEVEALEDGYRYRDRRFGNLSAVAHEITGTHWNGPRFFGLREQRP